MSALDAGCRPGRMAVALALSGFEVTAIESSADMREQALARAADAAVRARYGPERRC
jgi:2-polyprenyl-3-methyl-5-hydroxy-6-metoxy-1,4-benzoquinol methylase